MEKNRGKICFSKPGGIAKKDYDRVFEANRTEPHHEIHMSMLLQIYFPF